MKIAFIVDSFPKFSETFIIDQVTTLLDLGHDVSIFPAWPLQPQEVIHPDVQKCELMNRVSYVPPTPPNKLARGLAAARIVLCGLLKCPTRTLNLVRLVLAKPRNFSLRTLHFLSRFPSGGFDIVHCHYGHNGILALQLKDIGALPPRTRIVTTFHGYDEHILPVQVLRARYADLFRRADLFTANTEFTKRKIVALGAEPAKVAILPASLHVARFSAISHTSNHQCFRLLTIARLVEKKGLAYAISAVAQLKDKSKLVYKIAGDGPLRAQLEAQVGHLGLGDVVSFLGAVDQNRALELYADADLFLLPSVTASDGEMEGQGLVLQEAQACGLPVISTWHNGIPEGVLDGETGILVPEKDSVALAQAIDGLRGDPERRARLGTGGRKWVANRYDAAILAAKLDTLYRELLSR